MVGEGSFRVGFEKDKLGICLTQVTTTCSVSGRGGLSAGSAGVGDPVFERGSLPGVLVPTALARWLPVSALRWSESVAGVGCSVGVRGVSSPSFGDCGDDLSRQPCAIDPLVSGSVVGNQPEERSQRNRLAARVGFEELQDGLDDAS